MKKVNRIVCLVVVLVLVALCVCGCTVINMTNKENDKATNDEFHNSLSNEDSKLKELKKSEYYKSLSEEEQSKLVDKFIESEKTLKSVANDPIDKTPEEIQQKIDELTTNGATEEEIKAAEQEKDYWTAVKTIKDATTNNISFNFFTPGMKIRKVNGIFKYQGTIYFNADFIKNEDIDGRKYYSQVNLFCYLNLDVDGTETFEEIMNIISSAASIRADKTCVNFNAESHKQVFLSKAMTDGVQFVSWKERGYNIEVIQSWELIENPNYPDFIVQVTNDKDSLFYLMHFSENKKFYLGGIIEKICPEFWAQLEVENAKK